MRERVCRRLGVALGVVLLTAACSAATSAPAVDVSGHWTVQAIQSHWGLHLNQEGERLTGTAVRSGTAPFSVYEVLGVVRGGALHMELRSLYPAARPEHWRLMGWAEPPLMGLQIQDARIYPLVFRRD